MIVLKRGGIINIELRFVFALNLVWGLWNSERMVGLGECLVSFYGEVGFVELR